jgi:hypothetical protein
MRKLALLIGAVGLAVGPASVSSWASSPFGNYAYVDPESGTDSSNCGGTSLANPSTGPCQSVNQALNNLVIVGNQGANIFILKGGLFGPIYITGKTRIIGPEDRTAQIYWSASTLPGCISAPAGSCNGSAPATYAVDIEAGANKPVQLKNIVIHAGQGTNAALHVGSAAALALQNVTLNGGEGTIPEVMLVAPSQGSEFELYMSQVELGLTNSGGGLSIAPSGATPVTVSINNSEILYALFGVQVNATSLTAGSNIAMTIDNTQFMAFTNSAVSIAAPSDDSTVSVALARSNIINSSGAALKINGSGASASLFETLITHNGTGVNLVNGGTGLSYQNNQISNNGTNCEVSSSSTPCSSALTSISQD